MIKRTHTCGQLLKTDINNIVSLAGWISKRRDHGGLIFIDLRDRYGKTQIVFNEEIHSEIFNIVKRLGLEDVIGIAGKVILRPNDAINPDMVTGEIDVEVTEIEVFNEADPMPFDVNDRDSAMEDHRLKYRFLELRTEELQYNIALRHKVALVVREYMSNQKFIEVETPILMKSTPEGARDFLVPSRIHNGKFYALPQSPQTYKQLLMVSGFDKYFQIVKCFRDEDFRADRQPEFTQIDIEMSFVEQEDVISMATGLTQYLFESVLEVKLPIKFPELSYYNAMEQYGSDKPDIRFDMKLQELSSFIEQSDFNAFKTILEKGGRVKGLVCPNGSNYSRKIIDELTEMMKTYYAAKGLAWMKCKENKLDGGISRFFPEKIQKKMIKELAINNGDILFIIGDDASIVWHSLGALRLELAKRENLIDETKWAPLWVVDFPLVEWNADEKRWNALHHPFTSPHPEDISMMDNDPGGVRSLGYDLVLNGYEIAGGSIRIHKQELQEKAFTLLGVDKIEAQEKFGFLMNAFRYGAPPHGGIAFGFDRIVMLMTGSKQIRDVIAFPKTTSAMSLMDNSPSFVDQFQLKELGLKLLKK